MKKPLGMVTAAELASGVILEDEARSHVIVGLTALLDADRIQIRVLLDGANKAVDVYLPLTKEVVVTGVVVL